MSKIFLFFPLFLFAIKPSYWWINDTIYLKKDYTAIYTISYKNQQFTLKFRWTLYKNDGLVMLYNYEGHPYQNILYKQEEINGFKKFIKWNIAPNSPYFMIYFRDFSNNIAKLQFLIYNPKKNIKIKLNEPRYRNINFVKQLPPIYQKDFEREIK